MNSPINTERKVIRNHWLSIVGFLWKQLKGFLFIVILATAKSMLYGAFALIGITGLLGVFGFLNWKNTYYYLEDENLYYFHGVFSKNKKVIPLGKIVTIDFTQSLLARAFQLYKVKLDTGSKEVNTSEIDILLSTTEAEALKATILSVGEESEESAETEEADETADTVRLGRAPEKKDGDRDRERIENGMPESKRFRTTPLDLTIHAITGNFILIGLGTFWGLYAFLDDIFQALHLETTLLDNAETYMEQAFKSDWRAIAFAVISIFVPFALIALVFSILGTNVRYYNFTAFRRGGKLYIEYGLLSKKKYTLPLEGMNAVTIKANFLRKLAGMGTIHVSSAGYGDEEKEEALLFPLANEKVTAEILRNLLPEMIVSEPLKKAPGRVLQMFILKPVVFWTLGVGAGMLLHWEFVFGLLMLPLIILAEYLEFSHSGLAYDEKRVVISRGAFSSKRTILPLEKIQVLTKKETYFQKRKQVCTYRLEFFGGKVGEAASVKHLDECWFQELCALPRVIE